MDITCVDVVDGGCPVIVSGTTARHLEAEIVAHTGEAHAHQLGEGSEDEVARHHARVLHRIEDMLAGGPGTPV